MPFATLGYQLSAKTVKGVWASLAFALYKDKLSLRCLALLLWSTALLQALTPKGWALAVRHLRSKRRFAGKRTVTLPLFNVPAETLPLPLDVAATAELSKDAVAANQVYQAWQELQVAHSGSARLSQPADVLSVALQVSKAQLA